MTARMLNGSTARFLLPITIVLYWLAGSYPFHWFSPLVAHQNNVSTTNQVGILFEERGIAFTETPPGWMDRAIRDNAFEVELDVRSRNTEQAGPARIFTISRDHYHRNLTVGQAGEDLVVRLRSRATGLNGKPEYVVRGVFRSPALRRIAVRVKPEAIRIEVNGHRRLVARLPADALSTWDPEYELALGNEFTFQRPWHGEVRKALVRVRDAEFTYTATNLRTPATYAWDRQLLLGKLLEPLSLSFERTDAADWIINLFGFAPFGILLALARGSPISMVIAFACCAALSLSVEVGQLFFEMRTPEAMDVLFNAMGGCIGAWIGNRALTAPGFTGTKLKAI